MSQTPQRPPDSSAEKPSSPSDTGAKKRYEPPNLVEYGDIATLTQTGGLTKTDTGTKKQRIG